MNTPIPAKTNREARWISLAADLKVSGEITKPNWSSWNEGHFNAYLAGLRHGFTLSENRRARDVKPTSLE